MADLISPDELTELLAQGREMTLLDVRWQLGRTDGYDEYLAGHLPGASYVDLETDLADPAGDGGRHPLPDPERFAEAMRRCGVNRSRTVVVYDATAGLAATRAWWLLRYHGHPDVRLLDGGWTSWRGPVETGETRVLAGDFESDPGHLPVIEADGAADVARRGVLLDARAPERFRGEHEPVDPVGGHVPGAVNLPTAENLRDDRWKSTDELAEIYAVTDRGGPVAVYCGSGVTATHDLFALHLLGRGGALYAGSWSHWVTDPDRPVATGP